MEYGLIVRDIFTANDGDHKLITEAGISHGLMYYPFHGAGQDKMEILMEGSKDFGLTKISPFIPKTVIKNDPLEIGKLVDNILSLGDFDEIYIEPSIDFPNTLDVEKRLIDAFLVQKSTLRFGVLSSHLCWLGKCKEILAAAPGSFPVPVIDDENMGLEEIFSLLKMELDSPKPVVVSLSSESKIDLPYLLDEYRGSIPELIFWSLYSLRDLNLPALKDVTKKVANPAEVADSYVALHSVGIRMGSSLAAELTGNTRVGSHYELVDIQAPVDGLVWAMIKEGGWVTLSQNGNNLFEKKGD